MKYSAYWSSNKKRLGKGLAIIRNFPSATFSTGILQFPQKFSFPFRKIKTKVPYLDYSHQIYFLTAENREIGENFVGW